MKKTLIALALIVLGASDLALAQSGRFELTPMAGYKLSNSFGWEEVSSSGSGSPARASRTADSRRSPRRGAPAAR